MILLNVKQSYWRKKLQMTTSTLRTELSKGLYFVALNSTVQDVFTMQHGSNIFLQSNIFLKLEKLFRSSSAAGGGVDQYNSKIIVSNKLASITFASPRHRRQLHWFPAAACTTKIFPDRKYFFLATKSGHNDPANEFVPRALIFNACPYFSVRIILK